MYGSKKDSLSAAHASECITTEIRVPPVQSINQLMLRVVRIVSYFEKILLITRTLRKPSKRDVTI